MIAKHYGLPEGLSGRAREAADIVMRIAHAYEPRCEDSGYRDFYTREEWVARGEAYGRNACLIVIHDGGTLAPLFNYAYESYGLMDHMDKDLKQAGFYFESCTCWYSAIYDERAE